MSLVLNVEILGEFKKLTAATSGASSNLSSLNKTASQVSRNMKRAFATIGLGVSFAVITRELKDATKAAVEDEKSMGLLANTLDNTVKATDAQKASIEKAITAMSLQAAVADDKIRPAYGNLIRATGDVAKSTDLMKLALDVAAGTGKDVETVSKAIAKAVGPDGTTGALDRLVPAIKGASDPMAVLGTMFAGAAETAANLDPYQQLTIAFGEIQETVGALLLPVLKDFATWLVDVAPTIQQFFKDLTDPTTEMGKKWGAMWEMIGLVGQQFNGLMDIFSGGKGGFSMVMDWITTLAAGLGQIMFYLGKLAQQWEAVFSADFGKAIDIAANYTRDYNSFVAGQNRILDRASFAGMTTTNNISINLTGTNVTANDIVQKLNKATKTNGTIGAAW